MSIRFHIGSAAKGGSWGAADLSIVSASLFLGGAREAASKIETKQFRIQFPEAIIAGRATKERASARELVNKEHASARQLVTKARASAREHAAE